MQKERETQKKITELQSKSALMLELEERRRREDQLALERLRRDKQACLEFLRAEQEAAVPVARVEAEELGLNSEFQLRDLPIEEPSECTQQFINSQPVDLKPLHILTAKIPVP